MKQKKEKMSFSIYLLEYMRRQFISSKHGNIKFPYCHNPQALPT